ncbi:MAG: hypothetical protein HDR14_16345 [Lachnospiraceae bacterium]|nr:hypothetical protein [Lachnospiraceae bacterium]
MKKVTQEDKEDFKKIHNIFNSIDEETKIYLTGYVHGLRDRENLTPYRKPEK